jgi:hypothetical protein
LLQNWWLQQQFVEVDLQYMVGCEAVFYFVEHPQPCIPKCFGTQQGSFFETETGDSQEGVCGEMQK